jgi:transposase InsO family protein
MAATHKGIVHFGIKTARELINAIHWWPTIYTDVEEYVKLCDTCQRYSRDKTNSHAIQLQVGQLFKRIAMDFVGPLPNTDTRNQYILLATEALTRWPLAKVTPTADAGTIAKFLYEDIVLQFGAPTTLLTDRGTHFLNRVVDHLVEIMETQHLKTMGYHPQTNGLTERFNGTLCKALAKCAYVMGKNWDLFVPTILFAYQVRKQTTTGQSPFMMMYGVEPHVPGLFQTALERFLDHET